MQRLSIGAFAGNDKDVDLGRAIMGHGGKGIVDWCATLDDGPDIAGVYVSLFHAFHAMEGGENGMSGMFKEAIIEFQHGGRLLFPCSSLVSGK